MDIPLFTRTQTAEQIPIDGSSQGLVATNVLDAIIELLGKSNAGPVRCEYRKITEYEANQKFLSLQATPSNPLHVGLDIIGGVPQLIGVDFTVTGTILDWSIGEMAGILAANDRVRILYSTIPEFQIIHVEMTPEILSAKSFALPSRAYYPDQIMLDVIGGVPQMPGIDFYVVDGLSISWEGTDLESLLETGDHIRIAFLK